MRYILLFLPALMLSAQTPPPAAAPAPAKKAAPVAAKPASAAPSTVLARNFKESGSPTAPITIEIYTDYECPACRDLYLNTLPALITDFVQTGKVRLVHRDYPLPQHQYSPQATRYANAAGEIGKYELVAQQIFQTQPEWSQSGNVDAQVAKVLSPADMAKVREIVKTDTKMQDGISKDVAQGNVDRLTQTPTMMIVAGGKREQIAGGMPYSILKSYLNKKLGQ
jgi:protein-disulfide isomerase